MLASLQYAALEKFCKHAKVLEATRPNTNHTSKLDLYFPGWQAAVQGRTVADFGCGWAYEVIELAHAGAAVVYGIEIAPRCLKAAREHIASSDVAERCCLVRTAADCEPVDIIFSFDSFEHFDKPGQILDEMHALLKPGGKLYVSFGPPWYNAVGGHAFSPFPWAHLVCSEKALVRWRNLYFPGTSVGINSSNLNRMTIRRFLSLCRHSGFTIEKHDLIPTRALKFLHNRLTREFTTSVVRAILSKKLPQPRTSQYQP